MRRLRCIEAPEHLGLSHERTDTGGDDDALESPFFTIREAKREAMWRAPYFRPRPVDPSPAPIAD